MFLLAIVCLSMAGLSALFWVVEAKPAFVSFKNIPVEGFQNRMAFPFRVIGTTFGKGGVFLIDFIATVSLTAIFGLGGLIGTTMALTISNVISVALLLHFRPWKIA